MTPQTVITTDVTTNIDPACAAALKAKLTMAKTAESLLRDLRDPASDPATLARRMASVGLMVQADLDAARITR